MKLRTIGKSLMWVSGAAAAGYAAYVTTAWIRYGRPAAARTEDGDPLLDRFMPVYDVVERHHIGVDAPAEVTYAAACEADLMQSPIVRAIFKGRELILRSKPDTAPHPRGMLAVTTSMGWRILAEIPGREVVVGAVTQPWEANVVFRPLPPHEFAAFNEPDFVKIVWTLRADPIGSDRSVFRTETRAVATSVSARAKFRRYWSFLSPGIIIIRWMGLGPVKAEAERRAQVRAAAVAS